MIDNQPILLVEDDDWDARIVRRALDLYGSLNEIP
jgi:hypothetical protein